MTEEDIAKLCSEDEKVISTLYNLVANSLDKEGIKNLDNLITLSAKIIKHSQLTVGDICNEFSERGCTKLIITYTGIKKNGDKIERKPDVIVPLDGLLI